MDSLSGNIFTGFTTAFTMVFTITQILIVKNAMDSTFEDSIRSWCPS